MERPPLSGPASSTWVSLPAISGLSRVTAVPASSSATTANRVRRWGVMYLRSWEYRNVLFLLVVVSELGDEHRAVAHFINETVFIIDAPGPVSGECVLEWFWFTDAFKWRALNIFNQEIDAF